MRDLPGLSVAAAGVLAARAAGCFAALPGIPAPEGQAARLLHTLTSQMPDAGRLTAASRALAPTHGGGEMLSPNDLACIEALWPLAVPTECLLASGGDDRLTLDPLTGRNRYGCTPWPQTEVIAFSSCTASSLSPDAFGAAEEARQSLIAATLRTAPSAALAEASDTIGATLLDHFGVADLADAVLAASGTDAALVVTGLLAAERPGETLTSILMSPSETGSGVPDAVQGRHFASSAAAGCKVGKGQPIEGMSLGPHLVTVALRHSSGAPRQAVEIATDCDRAIRAGIARGRVILHAIDGSKTGLTAPDRAACRLLAQAFGPALDIVVDACQARIEPALVRWYLQQGFPVLITGSKFFGAPGFCGAVLFPRARLRRIARDGRLPPGLAPYARLEGGFGSRRCPGLVLRWRAALQQMAEFGSLPAADVRQRLDAIGKSVRAALQSDNRAVLLEAPRPAGLGWSGRRSVFTFAIRGSQGWLSPTVLRRLYEALDDETPARAYGGPSYVTRCQIGQPVELGAPTLGGLRIAISAAQIVSGQPLDETLHFVLTKLAHLLDAGVGHPGLRARRSQPVDTTPRSALLTG